MYKPIEWVAFMLLACVWVACGESNEVVEIEKILYGELEVCVRNEFDQNLEGAKVASGSISATTNQDGICRILSLKEGTHKIEVSKEGFVGTTEQVTLKSGVPEYLTVKLKAGDATLSVDKTELKFQRKGGTQEISIESNAGWTVEATVDWITFNVNAGGGNATVEVQVQENKDSVRSGEIIITAGDKKKTVNVHQAEPIRIMDIRYELGSDGDFDYFEIDYNMPVYLNGKIEEPWNTLTDFEPVSLNARKTLRINYGNLGLGGEYTFKIPVKNEDGDTYNDPVTIKVYTSKWHYEGRFRFFRLDNDGKTAWATTRDPNRLLQISLEDGSIVKSFDLPYAPGDFTVNPYNGMLYVTFTDQQFSEYNTTIAVIDPKTGKWVHEIPFDFMDDEQYPMIYPFDIEFTKEGWGMVLVCSNGSSGHLWCYMDTADDHRIIRAPKIADYFGEVHPNFDQTKLFAFSPFKIAELFLVDGVDSQPAPYKFTKYTYGNFTRKVFHRKRNSIFFAAPPYYQFILDVDTDTYSELTYASSFDAFADFDYTVTDSNRLWYFYGDYSAHLYILDMDKSTWLFHHPTAWYGMHAVHSLMDEKHLLVLNVDYNDPVSDIYLLDIKEFSRHFE